MLTSTRKSQHFDAGYYDEFTVSTDISDAELRASISYILGHKHIGTPNGTSPSGCYTAAYSSYEQTGSDEIWGWCSGPWTNCGDGEYVCRCGWHGYNQENGEHRVVVGYRPKYGYVTRYGLGCGKQAKEHVRDTEDVDDVHSDEVIIGVTVMY